MNVQLVLGGSWEEVVVGASQVWGGDERQRAHVALARQLSHTCSTPGQKGEEVYIDLFD